MFFWSVRIHNSVNYHTYFKIYYNVKYIAFTLQLHNIVYGLSISLNLRRGKIVAFSITIQEKERKKKRWKTLKKKRKCKRKTKLVLKIKCTRKMKLVLKSFSATYFSFMCFRKFFLKHILWSTILKNSSKDITYILIILFPRIYSEMYFIYSENSVS